MASLFTSLPRTATPTIYLEILQTCQHQLPQALAASTAHHIITSLRMGHLLRDFLRFSCLCWCSSHNLRLITKPLLDKVSANQQASTSSCLRTTLKISRKIFIAETSFWAAMALAKFHTPPRALHRHTRVPCKLSEESRADYQTLLVLLLITNCDAFLTTSILLPIPFSARLLQCRLQYFLLHIKPPWNSGDSFIAEISFWPRIALINAAHPQVCWTHLRDNVQHTRVLDIISEESQVDYHLLALLLVADGDALLATSAPLPGPFSSIFLALPICYVCRQTSLACPFTL